MRRRTLTCTAAVPTVWLSLLQHLEATGGKLSHLKKVVIGGAACPRAITKAFQGFSNQGAAGDYYVLFLSGHGGRTNGNKGPTWFFLPVDFHPQRFVNTAAGDPLLHGRRPLDFLGVDLFEVLALGGQLVVGLEGRLVAGIEHWPWKLPQLHAARQALRNA